jgi:hypothetical protein
VALHPLNPSWNLEVFIFAEGGKPENLEKNPQSKGENQQTTLLTCDPQSGNQKGPQRREASTPTATPPMLPKHYHMAFEESVETLLIV